jgi:hypothetical protein
MKHLIAFLGLTILAQLAFAGAYEDRQNLAYQRQQRATIQKIETHARKMEESFMRDLLKFGQKYSGFAKTPDCDLSSRTYNNAKTFRTKTKKSCYQGFCVKITGEFENPNRYKNHAGWAEIVAIHNSIGQCDVILRNGLACRVRQSLDKDDRWVFGGNCLDTSGNSKLLLL